MYLCLYGVLQNGCNNIDEYAVVVVVNRNEWVSPPQEIHPSIHPIPPVPLPPTKIRYPPSNISPPNPQNGPLNQTTKGVHLSISISNGELPHPLKCLKSHTPPEDQATVFLHKPLAAQATVSLHTQPADQATSSLLPLHHLPSPTQPPVQDS